MQRHTLLHVDLGPQYYIGQLLISNMPTIKSVLVQYNPINNSNTHPQVILELEKGCKITFISVNLKRKSKIKWKEKTGSNVIQDEEYLNIEQLTCYNQVFLPF